MIKFGILAVAAVSVVWMSAAFAQTTDTSQPTPQQVDAYVEKGMKELHVPGAAIALFSNGKITHVKGFGLANDAGALVTAQTPFQVGSISKSFAALIILQLADKGKLSLDDPIVQHIPFFRTDNKAASDLITIRHLLNHRSGISTLDGNRSQSSTYRGTDAMGRVALKLRDARLHAKPGARFEYSNANYALLVHLIETVEKRPYEEVVEARIFSKLGMRNSFVQMPKTGSASIAVGHTQWFGYTVERNFIAGRMMVGPGGVTASAEDLATYLIAVFEHDPRIVPATLSDALSRERRGGYEFGWEFDTIGEQKLIFHSGLNPGFFSKAAYNPKTRQGALILTNMSGSLEGNLVGGTVSYALSLPTDDIVPAPVNLWRLWGTLALAIVLSIASALSVRSLWKPERARRFKRFDWIFLTAPSLSLLGLSYFLAVMVPQFSGVNLTAVYMFYPDVGALLFVCASISVIWAIARVLLIARRHRL